MADPASVAESASVSSDTITAAAPTSLEVLPTFSLHFSNSSYTLFAGGPSVSESSTDQVLFEGQEGLLQVDLAAFLDALRTHFNLTCDLKVTFPSLNSITFNNNMVWATQVHLCDLASMHTTLAGSEHPFTILVEEEKSSFVHEYNSLIELVEANKAKKAVDTTSMSTEPETVIEEISSAHTAQAKPEESGEEDDVEIDEVTFIAPATIPNTTTMSTTQTPEAATEADPEEEGSSESDTMQVSSLDSPVAGGRLLEQQQLQLSTAETSPEEERSEHYLRLSSSTAAVPAEAQDLPPQDQQEEEHVQMQVDEVPAILEVEPRFIPISTASTPAPGADDLPIDIDDSAALAVNVDVPPAANYTSSDLATSVEVLRTAPSVPAIEIHPPQAVEASEEVVSLDEPRNGTVEADIDVDAETASPEQRRKRPRDEEDPVEVDEVEITPNDLQEYEHVAKRAKVAEAEEAGGVDQPSIAEALPAAT